jgi:hypothetical protein
MPFKNSIPGEALERRRNDGGMGRGQAVQDDRPEGVQADQVVRTVRCDGGAFEEEVEQVEPELLLCRVVDPHFLKCGSGSIIFFLTADPDPVRNPGSWRPKIEKNLRLKKNWIFF